MQSRAESLNHIGGAPNRNDLKIQLSLRCNKINTISKSKNDNFGDDDLKDAPTGGDDDQDGIREHEHYDNISIELCSFFCICCSQLKSCTLYISNGMCVCV